jgi:hypothetical protein
MAIRGSVEKPLLSDCPVSQSHHVEKFQNQLVLEVALTIYGKLSNIVCIVFHRDTTSSSSSSGAIFKFGCGNAFL